MRILRLLTVLTSLLAVLPSAQAAWPGGPYEDIWVVATRTSGTHYYGDQTTVVATVYARVDLRDVEVQFLLPSCAEFMGGDAWKNVGDMSAGEHRQVTVRVMRTKTEGHTCKFTAIGFYGVTHARTVIEDGQEIFEVQSSHTASGRSMESLGLPPITGFAPPNLDDYVFNPHTGKYERWARENFVVDPNDAQRWVRRAEPAASPTEAPERRLVAEGRD